MRYLYTSVLIILLFCQIGILQAQESNNYFQTLSDSNTTFIGRWTDGDCYTIEISENIAFVGQGKALTLYDITNSSKPIMISQITFQDIVRDIKVANGFAFVANEEEGLRVVDYSNPSIINEVGYINTNGKTVSVELNNGFAYLSEEYDDLRIIDISDVFNPTEVAHIDTIIGLVYNSLIDENRLFIVSSNIIAVYDITTPPSPSFITYINLNTSGKDLIVEGNIAYVATGIGLKIVDISVITNPVELGLFPNTNFPRSITKNNSYVYLLDGKVHILDVSNPSNPVQVNEIITGAAEYCIVNDLFLYLADQETGFRVYDNTNPESPIEIFLFAMSGASYDLVYDSDFVYLAETYAGMRIIDVTNPYLPLVVGTFLKYPGWVNNCRSVAVNGNYAFISNSTEITIVDISDKTNPVEASTLVAPGSGLFQGIFLDNELLYTTNSSQGLFIIDVTDPTSPEILGQYQSGSMARIVVQGDYAIVACLTSGVKIFNVSVPNAITLVSSIQTGNESNDVYVDGNVLYVADGTNGLRIYNISNPSSPYEIGYFDPGDMMFDVILKSNYAYVSSYQVNYLLDITNPSSPTHIGHFANNSINYGVTVNNNLVYLASGYDGLEIFKNDLVSSSDHISEFAQDFSLSTNYPNPFNPSTKIRYEIPERAFVTLKVYDVLGNEIETLVEAEKSNGNYELEFNASGLPSGIYFYQLQSGSFFETKKMILLK